MVDKESEFKNLLSTIEKLESEFYQSREVLYKLKKKKEKYLEIELSKPLSEQDEQVLAYERKRLYTKLNAPSTLISPDSKTIRDYLQKKIEEIERELLKRGIQ